MKHFGRMNFELTPPGTTNQNEIVENGMCTMTTHDGKKPRLGYDLNVKQLQLNLKIFQEVLKKSEYKIFYHKMLEYQKQLITFREIRVVRSIIIVKYKLEDKGLVCMFFGYA